jgi:HEAT repeat protein
MSPLSLLLAASIAAFATAQEGSPPREVDPVALVRDLSSKDAAARQKAHESLLAMGEKAVPALLRGIHAEVPEGRRLAVRILRTMADPRAGKPLWQRLPAEPDEAVRAEIVYALGAIRPEDLARGLADQLRYETEPRVLRALLATLGELGDPRVVGAILEFSETHAEDRYLLAVSTRALGDLTGRRRFGVDLLAWRKWWDEHGAEFVRRYEESLAEESDSPQRPRSSSR